MRKTFFFFLLLTLVGFSNLASASCLPASAVSFTFTYCKNLTVYNNDTGYAMSVNSTVQFFVNAAELISAGKAQSSGADLIIAYGKQEIGRFNGTEWNNDTVPVFVNLQAQIARSGSDSNYSLYYGDPGASLASRNANISSIATFFGEDFLGTTLNASGLWGFSTTSGGQVTVNCFRGTCNFYNANASQYNLLGFDKSKGSGVGSMPAKNTSIWWRFVNETDHTGVQYLSGMCQLGDTAGCGAFSEPAYSFRGGGLFYGSDVAPVLDYVPSGSYQMLKIKNEPTASRQQYWRNFNQTNPGNTTLNVTNWFPSWGNDGSAQKLNYTIDWVIVGNETTVNAPTGLFGAEDTPPTPASPVVQIYAPTNTTYYNLTTTTLTFSINSSSNSSSMMVWVNTTVLGQYYLGTVANGSINSTTILVQNGQNYVTVKAYDSIAALNGTATTNYTLTNGLNITVYNASQGITTNLTVDSLNVSNSTNSSLLGSTSTPIILDTRTIPNGGATNQTVNVTVTKSGYVPLVYENNVTSGNNSLFNVFIPLWRLQEFKANSNNGSALTTFSFVVNSGSNITSYSTTNGSVYVSLGSIPTGNFVGTYQASGYNSTNVTFNANSTSEINYTATIQAAGVVIFAFDEASCSGTCQRIYFSYSASNSTNTTNNYTNIYYTNESYNAFPQGTVTFTFNNSVNGSYFNRNYILTIDSSTATTLNVYLLNSSGTTGLATYCVQTTTGAAIGSASLTFQRSISGSYVTIAQGTAGSDGCYSLYLDFLVTYQVIASATGYNTGTFTAQPKSIQYIQLTSGAVQKGFQISYSDDDDIVETKLLPFDEALNGDWILVNFTVYSKNATLTNWGLYCDYNGSAIYNVNVTTSPSGGSTTSNITLTNKTNNFYCYGLFDRVGYNTTFINRTFYINFANVTYLNSSIGGGVSQVNTGNFSTQTLASIAIVGTVVITAFIAPYVPVGSGIIAAGVFSGFAFLGFIPVLWYILFLAITLAYAYFNSRQF